MSDALIGVTGFVGGNLARQHPFDAGFHSRNVHELRGQRFDLLVCAGNPAEKWRANQEPAADRASIDTLVAALSEVAARRLVLISTVDVYPRAVEVDEETPIDLQAAQPYGRHRRELELFVRERFPDALILRLPGLFGPGLKKNVIFDLLHSNQLHVIHADSAIQFYALEHLWADIERCWEHGIHLLNVAPQPVQVSELAREAFGMEFTQRPTGVVPVRYDFRSRHAHHWGGLSGGYLYPRNQVLEEMKRFVEAERSRLR